MYSRRASSADNWSTRSGLSPFLLVMIVQGFWAIIFAAFREKFLFVLCTRTPTSNLCCLKRASVTVVYSLPEMVSIDPITQSRSYYAALSSLPTPWSFLGKIRLTSIALEICQSIVYELVRCQCWSSDHPQKVQEKLKQHTSKVCLARHKLDPIRFMTTCR